MSQAAVRAAASRTRAALQLSPLLFQHPGQLRLAHWEDIDFEHKLWRCPPEKMKLRKRRDSRTPVHLVPLPDQAIGIMRDLLPLTGPSGVEDGSGITLYADLPGVSRDNLHLQVESDTLTIEAESGLSAPEGLESNHPEAAGGCPPTVQ